MYVKIKVGLMNYMDMTMLLGIIIIALHIITWYGKKYFDENSMTYKVFSSPWFISIGFMLVSFVSGYALCKMRVKTGEIASWKANNTFLNTRV